MPRELKDFLNLHAGETAWLFGKGPSLDRFDMRKAGKLRVAINDVVKEVPGCRYGFANDSVAPWRHVYRPEHVLFQPLRVAHDIHAAQVEVDCERIWYPDDRESDRLGWSAEQLAHQGLCIRRGTLGSAGQILYVMGVRQIVCVGIDGGGRHADRKWNTELRHDHAIDYNAIRDAFITACLIQGIAVTFFGADQNETQLPNGMKVVKLLSTILVEGTHRCEGEVFACSPSVAEDIVSQGLAIYWRQPGPKTAAEVPTPVVETVAAAPVAERAVSTRRRRS